MLYIYICSELGGGPGLQRAEGRESTRTTAFPPLTLAPLRALTIPHTGMSRGVRKQVRGIYIQRRWLVWASDFTLNSTSIITTDQQQVVAINPGEWAKGESPVTSSAQAGRRQWGGERERNKNTNQTCSQCGPVRETWEHDTFLSFNCLFLITLCFVVSSC